MPVETLQFPPLTLHDLHRHPAFRFDRPGGGRVRREAEALLEVAAERELFDGMIAHEVAAIGQVTDDSVALAGGQAFHLPRGAGRLARATHILAGACTLGPAVSHEIDRLGRDGKRLAAVLLDSIAAVALLRLSEALQARADAAARDLGVKAGGRMNPGNSGFDLAEQPKLLALAGAERIGIALTIAHMMNPRFSMTAIFGLGRGMKRPSGAEQCEECAARDRCAHSLALRPEKDGTGDDASRAA